MGGWPVTFVGISVSLLKSERHRRKVLANGYGGILDYLHFDIAGERRSELGMSQLATTVSARFVVHSIGSGAFSRLSHVQLMLIASS